MDCQWSCASHTKSTTDDLFFVFWSEYMIEDDLCGGDNIETDAELARVHEKDLDFPLFKIGNGFINGIGISFNDFIFNVGLFTVVGEASERVIIITEDEGFGGRIVFK